MFLMLRVVCDTSFKAMGVALSSSNYSFAEVAAHNTAAGIVVKNGSSGR